MSSGYQDEIQEEIFIGPPVVVENNMNQEHGESIITTPGTAVGLLPVDHVDLENNANQEHGESGITPGTGVDLSPVDHVILENNTNHEHDESGIMPPGGVIGLPPVSVDHVVLESNTNLECECESGITPGTGVDLSPINHVIFENNLNQEHGKSGIMPGTSSQLKKVTPQRFKMKKEKSTPDSGCSTCNNLHNISVLRISMLCIYSSKKRCPVLMFNYSCSNGLIQNKGQFHTAVTIISITQ